MHALMTARPELTRLRALSMGATAAELSAKLARRRRDLAILDSLDAGASVAEIVEATGLSRPRVYQLRDKRVSG